MMSFWRWVLISVITNHEAGGVNAQEIARVRYEAMHGDPHAVCHVIDLGHGLHHCTQDGADWQAFYWWWAT